MGNFLAMLGIGLMVGLACVGSGTGTFIGGSAVIGMLKKKPESFGSGMILAGLPATQGLYGFVGFIMYNGAITAVGNKLSILQGSVTLGAGIAVGLACLITAITQGKVCANGIAAIGGGHDVFGKTMILAAFPEFYAILSLVVSILMLSLFKL